MYVLDKGVPAGPVAPADHRYRSTQDLVRLARPTQWLKNLLVLPIALIGAAGLTGWDLVRLGWAMLVFCLASSVVYVWNDLADRHRDRVHPVKRHRPLAAGRIGPGTARAYGVGLAGLLLAAMVLGPRINWWPLLAYLAVNVAYSRWLKQVPLVDVFAVAAGFVLRVVQGYVTLEVAAVSWLLIAVFAVCLLLILGKRRHEVDAAGAAHRGSLAGYSSQYLDHLMVLCAAVAASATLSYLHDDQTVAPYTDAVLLCSVPFVIFGLARYLQLVVVRSEGGDPVRVMLRDRVLIAVPLLWAVTIAAVVVISEHSSLGALLVREAS
jgi:4-hydroxybenzoate polyprenyltransferase